MPSSRRPWLFAGALALLLHAFLFGTAVWQLPRAAAQPEQPQPLLLSFATADAEQPQRYVEQPRPDEAEASEDARFLSDADAVARDPDASGGELDPRQTGDREYPGVAMESGAAPSESPPATESAPLRTVADPVGELTRVPSEAAPKERSLVREGSAEELFDQPDAERLGSGVDLFGEVQLSTVAWEYAPWLQRFRAALIRNWHAPYAFHLGLIHGRQRIRVDVGRDGQLLSLTLLDSEGHESLRGASLAAFRGAAPFAPLPDHFPDPSLSMTWTLIYPERRR